MIGYHSVAVIVDAYLKGFRGFDAEAAYQAMRDTAMQDRNGLKSYQELGYVASTPGGEATSRTLDMRFDDWCLARMAEALGHTEDAQLFYQRAANYRNLFDRTVGFFRGRKADGSWRTPFVANRLGRRRIHRGRRLAICFRRPAGRARPDCPLRRRRGLCSEARCPVQCRFDHPDDIPDISGLIGQYSQGDEQCHHVAYLYDYAGAPYKTQQRVRQVMDTLYDDTPAGQCGNVDCGQMAAWYVFSALGFYPVNPDSGVYMHRQPGGDQGRLEPGRQEIQGPQVHHHRQKQQP